ncbi:hypothetical protein VI06_06270 [Aquitalea magnusonii]|nr:hypothetical protein VI06_06270 [Aquitalea magnusonii]
MQALVVKAGARIGKRDVGKIFAIAAELVAPAARTGIQLRPQRTVHHTQAGPCLPHAGIRLGQIRAGLQGLLHQLAERGVVKHRPPALQLWLIAACLILVLRRQGGLRRVVIRADSTGSKCQQGAEQREEDTV